MSTTHASLLLKEIVHDYYKRNKMLYDLFADLLKAFDRVDDILLGDVLLDRGIPSDVVHLVMNHMARVRWGTSSDRYFYINTGLRQGGILSPFLFKVYIDDILNTINKLNVGCKLGVTNLNIMAYADDMVLLANNLSSLDNIFEIFIDNV